MDSYTAWLGEIRAEDFQKFGGKGANLGELTRAGFCVPEGFCIGADAYHYHVQNNKLGEAIAGILGEIDFHDITGLEAETGSIRRLITEAQIPEDLEGEIRGQYQRLQMTGEQPFVAIRSSVAVKGSTISSFPGMMDTFHYIRGEEQVLASVKGCWASLWSARAAATRHRKCIDHSLGLIAPLVQQMVDADAAGVMFTINPVSSSNEEMLIQSSWGIGESVVSGMCVTDFFILDKGSLSPKKSEIANKPEMVTWDRDRGCGRKVVAVESEKARLPSLTEAQLKELGDVGIRIENQYGAPQDIEWAYDQGKLYVLQTRKAR